ncbi:MAG: hypothetical protein E6R13_04315 [Spirochaetes bacterium]|nr:MAG: hypothetical protein E6R13_04315 [Spirochaetota bacterium]
MGKMKELFIELQEQEERDVMLEEQSSFQTDILCPNCTTTTLHECSAEDLYCEHCGYEFIKVSESTVRFK